MSEPSQKITLTSPLGRVLLAQALSSVGTSVTTVALAVMVFDLTGSVLHMGAVLAASTLPVMVMSFFGGALLDRYGGRSVMVAADICRAGVIVLMPFAAQLSVAYIYLLGVVIGSFSALFSPGQVKLVGELVSREQLIRANSYLSIAREGCELGGYMVGGFLVASLGYQLTFTLDAVSYLLSAALLLAVRGTARHTAPPATLGLLLRQSPDAVRTIWRSPALRTNSFLALLPMTMVLMATPNAYALALQVFERGPRGLAYMEVVSSFGWIVGGVLASKLVWQGDRNSYVVLSITCMSVCFALVSVTPWFWVAVVLLALGAMTNVGAIVGSMTLFQEIEERPDKGRIIAVRSGLGQLSATLGLLAGGLLGELLGIRTLFLFAGLSAVLLSTAVYLPYRIVGPQAAARTQTDWAP
jgi:DHA3 family macrolide efflux protein-like MFS transporter